MIYSCTKSCCSSEPKHSGRVSAEKEISLLLQGKAVYSSPLHGGAIYWFNHKGSVIGRSKWV